MSVTSDTQPSGRPALMVARGLVAACAITAGLLAVPTPAAAAEWLQIDGTKYECGTRVAAEDGSWKWDGANVLELDGYSGDSIAAAGKLEISCARENSLSSTGDFQGQAKTVLDVEDGDSEKADLLIKGPGVLRVNATCGADKTLTGITSKGDLTISEGTVEVKMDTCNSSWGILSFGKMTVEKNSAVKVDGRWASPDAYGNGLASNSGIEIDGSQVSVDNESLGENGAIASYGFQSAGPVSIHDDSRVDIKVKAANALGISSLVATDPAGPSISIVDSNIDVFANSTSDNTAVTFGIVAAGQQYLNKISIVRSTVTSDSPGGHAIAALNTGTADGDDEAANLSKIDLDGCEIVFPEGDFVCDLRSKLLYVDPDSGESMALGAYLGQFVGSSNTTDDIHAYGSSDFRWPEAMARKVVIKPLLAPDPMEPVTPVAPDAPETPATPVTPDTPTTPDTPASPEQPDTPATPDVPASPEKPVTTPVAPTPDAPAAKPGQQVPATTPAIADSPELPGTGDATAPLSLAAIAMGGLASLRLAIAARRRNG